MDLARLRLKRADHPKDSGGEKFSDYVRDLGSLELDVRDIDADWLVAHGLSRGEARAICDECVMKRQIVRNDRPLDMMGKTVEARMIDLKTGVDSLREKMGKRLDTIANIFERTGLKHLKSAAMMRRVCRAQRLPPGWLEMMDNDGNRYFYCESTGKTAWTLPRGGGGGDTHGESLLRITN